MPKSFLCFFFLITIGHVIRGQQNSTLFFMSATPQANFVNPAVCYYCNWTLGIPILSSIHSEVGIPSLTFHQVLKKQSNNTYLFDGSQVMNHLGNVNYLTSEFHTNLFYLGFWEKKNFFSFSVNEKADFFLTYPKDFFAMAWNGNSQFVGQTAELSHLAAFLNYRREYAFGLTRQSSNDFAWGVRAKLLFGKLNTSTIQSRNSLYTEPVTYNLDFSAQWKLNTSIPFGITLNPDGTLRDLNYQNNIGKILMNRQNWGFAVDLGFIHYRDEKVTVSGSILDLGFIRWKSNGYSFSQNHRFTYQGTLTDTVQQSNYLEHLGNVLLDQFGINTHSGSYFSFLNPMIYYGATYQLGEGLNAGGLISGRINRYKITSGFTLSLNKDWDQKAALSISWSYIYKTWKNFGAGIRLGRSPLQFYAVTDNILGLIKPLDTNNINIRFGLQFSFGCFSRNVDGDCGCSWLNNEKSRRERILRLKNSL